jgi:hypothetical protein
MLTFIADRKQDDFGDLTGSSVHALRGFTQVRSDKSSAASRGAASDDSRAG